MRALRVGAGLTRLDALAEHVPAQRFHKVRGAAQSLEQRGIRHLCDSIRRGRRGQHAKRSAARAAHQGQPKKIERSFDAARTPEGFQRPRLLIDGLGAAKKSHEFLKPDRIKLKRLHRKLKSRQNPTGNPLKLAPMGTSPGMTNPMRPEVILTATWSKPSLLRAAGHVAFPAIYLRLDVGKAGARQPGPADRDRHRMDGAAELSPIVSKSHSSSRNLIQMRCAPIKALWRAGEILSRSLS